MIVQWNQRMFSSSWSISFLYWHKQQNSSLIFRLSSLGSRFEALRERIKDWNQFEHCHFPSSGLLEHYATDYWFQSNLLASLADSIARSGGWKIGGNGSWCYDLVVSDHITFLLLNAIEALCIEIVAYFLRQGFFEIAKQKLFRWLGVG